MDYYCPYEWPIKKRCRASNKIFPIDPIPSASTHRRYQVGRHVTSRVRPPVVTGGPSETGSRNAAQKVISFGPASALGFYTRAKSVPRLRTLRAARQLTSRASHIPTRAIRQSSPGWRRWATASQVRRPTTARRPTRPGRGRRSHQRSERGGIQGEPRAGSGPAYTSAGKLPWGSGTMRPGTISSPSG